MSFNSYLGYEGKVCVVTGASSGMGRATTKILVDLGAKVYAIARRDSGVDGVAKNIHADLSKREDIDAAFAQLPKHIDCFFGVAGLSGGQSDFMTTFNVNYTANRYMAETYLKERMSEGGAIMFVTSAAGVAWRENIGECNKILAAETWDEIQQKMSELTIPGTPSPVAYMLSKRVANAYACHLAVELGERGIRVNALMPGSTATGMLDDFVMIAGGMDNLVRDAGKAGRLATSEEVAEPIVFLNSNMARFVSGEELMVDYCDNAMKKIGQKENLCRFPALPSDEELAKFHAQNNN